MSETKYFCKSQLKDLGFTDKMIKDLVLRPPILKTNPHYKKAAPMQIWEQTYIYDIMDSEPFSVAKAKSEGRKIASKKALHTKRKTSMVLLEKAINSIEVEYQNPIDIEKNALEAKACWYEWCGKFDSDVYSADQETINRWCVNYIRHNLTNYEAVLWSFKRKVGKEEMYELFREAVMKKIANIYPQFFDTVAA